MGLFRRAQSLTSLPDRPERAFMFPDSISVYYDPRMKMWRKLAHIDYHYDQKQYYYHESGKLAFFYDDMKFNNMIIGGLAALSHEIKPTNYPYTMTLIPIKQGQYIYTCFKTPAKLLQFLDMIKTVTDEYNIEWKLKNFYSRAHYETIKKMVADGKGNWNVNERYEQNTTLPEPLGAAANNVILRNSNT